MIPPIKGKKGGGGMFPYYYGGGGNYGRVMSPTYYGNVYGASGDAYGGCKYHIMKTCLCNV